MNPTLTADLEVIITVTNDRGPMTGRVKLTRDGTMSIIPPRGMGHEQFMSDLRTMVEGVYALYEDGELTRVVDLDEQSDATTGDTP